MVFRKGDITMKKLIKGVATRMLCVLAVGVITFVVIPSQSVYGADTVCEHVNIQPFDLFFPCLIYDE